jgi:acid phosphatase
MTSPVMEELEPRVVLSVPTPDHVVIVIEENHGYTQIIGSSQAPYINSLAQQGALLTNSYAITHPSQPNYLALYSGSTQGITSDSCPHTFSTPNLGGELEAAGLPFGGFSEDLPAVGSTVCSSGSYMRKHNPWVNFTDVPAADNMPFAGYFPDDYSTLPTVSFVIPNQRNDMHDGPVQQGDNWLSNNLDAYVQWTYDNNSLLILTFDEDNNLEGNHIATIFVGPMVNPGQYSETVNHYNVLRTIEDMYGLDYAGVSGNYDPIEDVWVDGAGPRAHSPLKNVRGRTPVDAALELTAGRLPASLSRELPLLDANGSAVKSVGISNTASVPAFVAVQPWAEDQASALERSMTPASAVDQLFLRLPAQDPGCGIEVLW